jgi:hypothetical protein
MILQNNKPGTSSLFLTIVLSLVTTLVVLGFCYFYFPEREVLLGVVAGAAFGIPNYVLWVKLVEKLTQSGGGKKNLSIFMLLGLKMLLIIGVVGASFMILKVHALAFAAGFFCLILVVILQNLVTSLSNKD